MQDQACTKVNYINAEVIINITAISLLDSYLETQKDERGDIQGTVLLCCHAVQFE